MASYFVVIGEVRDHDHYTYPHKCHSFHRFCGDHLGKRFAPCRQRHIHLPQSPDTVKSVSLFLAPSYKLGSG